MDQLNLPCNVTPEKLEPRRVTLSVTKKAGCYNTLLDSIGVKKAANPYRVRLFWALSDYLNPYMAVREGVEPSIPYDIHTFQACSFGHSDTSPKIYFHAIKIKYTE